MSHVRVLAKVTGKTVDDIFPLISDFASYPAHCPVVRSVRVTGRVDDKVISEWDVYFRKGILRWTEEDTFDTDGKTIRFVQLEGDIDNFVGEWTFHDDPDGCLVRFAADFDMGIPSLSHIIDPIAEVTLRTNICLIITGLVGEAVSFPDAEAAATERTEAAA